MTSKLPGVVAAVGLSLLAPAICVGAQDPADFEIAASDTGPVTFVVYGDTRFTDREKVANAPARRALVAGIAREHPAAIFIGGDLVYEGSNPHDYEVYSRETAQWTDEKLRVFPVLGNHEFRGCDADLDPCLENWWNAFPYLRPHRWYSVSVGSSLLALILDSEAPLRRGSEQRAWFERQIAAAGPQVKFLLIMLHYPPVRDPIYPSMKDEKEIHRYLSRNIKSLHERVIVVGSHIHNYERYERDGVTYLVSGGGGAKPVPAIRIFGELSKLRTSVNYHYVRLVLDAERLSGTMVRFDATVGAADAWSEPDHFEIKAK